MGPKLLSKICYHFALCPFALFHFLFAKEKRVAGEILCYLYSGVFVTTVIWNSGTWRVFITDIGTLGQEDSISVFAFVFLMT